MIILDTQPVSQLQRAGSSDAARIEQRINAYSAQDVWITVITPFEQFKGCIAAISAVKAREAVVAIWVSAATHRALQSPMERANLIFRCRRGDGVTEVFAAIGSQNRRPRCTYRRHRAGP